MTTPGLPTVYRWLDYDVAEMPKMVSEGLKLYGVHELAGGANSATIMGWAAEVGLKATYTADKIPWCGLWMAVVAKRAGKPVPAGPLWALNWKKFGQDGGQPELGDVLVFLRDGGGHVGIYIGEDRGTAAAGYEDAAYHVLGGNTTDQVKIGRVLKKRLVACRQPAYSIKPAGAVPHILTASGALSTNEA